MEIKITREMLRAYAEASGDLNPIHLDDEAARRAGLPGVIAHGMLTAGFLASRAYDYIRDELKRDDLSLHKLHARFRAMAVPGDVISVDVAVRSQTMDSVVLDLTARNQRGEAVTTGTTESWVRR